jgi:trimethylamine--corrinoid protein Co-methyltransferase
MSTRRSRRRAWRPNQRGQPAARKLPAVYGGAYKPLSEREVRAIHNAALTILEEVGIEVMPSTCREVWREAGARVEDDENRVYISRDLVRETLKSAASEVTLYGQIPEYDVVLGGRRVFLGTGGAAVKVLHLDGVVRESKLRDLYDIGRMVDKLHNIHFYQRSVVARDMPDDVLDVNTFYACFSATQKHIMGSCLSPEHVREVKALAALIAGGEDKLRERQLFSCSSSWVVSPLRYAPETVETLNEQVKQGIPVALSSAPQAGATAPVTLAGTLAQLMAEQVSGMVYVNLLRPGHPALLGCVPSVSDMRTGAFSGGGAEFALMNAAAAQLAQHLNLPVYISSAVTDSKLPDAQAGYEKGVSTATGALAGANYIHHSAGMLESLLTVGYEQYVVDDDINGTVMRLVRGIEVNDETLSIDVIKDVCEGAGHFLGHPQTLRKMKSEYYYPHTADRNNRDGWIESGSMDMRERARLKAQEILNTHWPDHISSGLDTRIRQQFDIRLPRSVMRREDKE